jgi:hypothetical protein
VPTWLIALITGSVLTWLIAYAGRIPLVRREIDANDRALGVIDGHLVTWVTDDTVRLRRHLRDISETLNKEGNLFWSSHHGQQIALAKEGALHAYRDQERTARSQQAEIGAREGRWHSIYRAWKKRPFGLKAPERVKPVLDAWAAPVTRHLSNPAEPAVEVDDPRKRTVESTLADLGSDPKALT